MPVAEVKPGTFTGRPCPSGARSRRRGERTCFARSRAARRSSRSCPRGPGSRRAISSASSTRPRSATSLTNQRITTQGAEANLPERQARSRDRRDRGQGVPGRNLPADRATIQGEIKLAESALLKARARLERTRELAALNELSPGRGRPRARVTSWPRSTWTTSSTPPSRP